MFLFVVMVIVPMSFPLRCLDFTNLRVVLDWQRGSHRFTVEIARYNRKFYADMFFSRRSRFRLLVSQSTLIFKKI